MRLALLVTTLLAACGGGGDDPPARECKQSVVIPLYGDSTNDGVDGATHQRASPDPQHALQVRMDARFGAGRVIVLNRAVSGTTSADLATVGDGDFPIINFGINNARRGMPLADYSADLEHFYRPGVVFKTPNPIWEPGSDDSAYAAAMKAVAAKLGAPVIDTQAYVLGLPDWQSMVPDGLHPTAALYDAIAEDSMKTLTPLVDAALCH